MARFFYLRDTLGGSSKYVVIEADDIPEEFLRSGEINLFAGDTTLDMNGFSFIINTTDTSLKIGNDLGGGIYPSNFSSAGAIITNVDGSTAPTQAPGDNSTKLATTAFVAAGLALKQALLVSGTNIKTINGVTLLGSGDMVISSTLADGTYSDIIVSGTGTVFTIKSSVALAGNPTTTTQTAGDNSTKIATTAYVDALTALTSAWIVVGNGSNVATGVPMSGVIAIDNAGVTSLAIDRWKLTGTSTSTGAMTLAGGNNLTFNLGRIQHANTYTTTASLESMNTFSGTVTARATGNDVFSLVAITGTVKSGVAAQNGYGLYLAPTFDATSGAFTTRGIFRAVGAVNDVLIDHNGRFYSGGGLSMDLGTAAGANVINYSTGTGTIGFSSNGRLNLNFGSITTQQSMGMNPTATFAPVSGTGTYTLLNSALTLNQTGTANGATINAQVATVPTGVLGTHTQLSVNTAGGVTTAGTWIGIDYNPTVTSIATHYGALIRSGNSGFGTATPTERVVVNGNLSLITAGSGIKVAEGSNATMGTATLSGGTIVVSTTKVTANSRIFLTVNGGTLTNVGTPYVSARTAGTSFTITSTNASDASNVAWIIIEPN